MGLEPTKKEEKNDIIDRLYNEYQPDRRKNSQIKTMKKDKTKKTQTQPVEKDKNMKKKNSEKYKKVEKYEESIDDLEEKNNWLEFKMRLAFVLLSATLVVGKGVYDKVQESIDNKNKENEYNIAVEIVKNQIDLIEQNSNYKFRNLSEEELVDAVSKISIVEDNMHITTYQSYFLTKGKDQILLEKILENAYGEEFKTYSPEKVRDLKKLAYELLDDDKEKQEYVRDPERVREAEEKQKERLYITEDEREMGE